MTTFYNRRAGRSIFSKNKKKHGQDARATEIGLIINVNRTLATQKELVRDDAGNFEDGQ